MSETKRGPHGGVVGIDGMERFTTPDMQCQDALAKAISDAQHEGLEEPHDFALYVLAAMSEDGWEWKRRR